MSLKYLIPLLATMFLTVSALMLYGTLPVSASAPSGLPASVRLATTTIVGPQQTKKVFSNNGSCASRIIRTQATEIYLTYSDPNGGDVASTTLSAVVGDFIAASTSKAFDGGIYGCGDWYIEATASTTITVYETN